MTRDERSRTIEKSPASTRDLALHIVDLEDERDDLIREAQEWKAERDKLERINKTMMATNRELGDALRFQHKVYNELARKAEELKTVSKNWKTEAETYRLAITECISLANGREEDWGMRAINSFGFLHRAIETYPELGQLYLEPSSKPETDQP